MKLGDSLQVAKLYLQYKGKTAKTAAKKFQGITVAKLSYIDSKIKLTDKIKAIKKKITDRKTTIKITIKQYNEQTTTKVKIKGNKNFNADSLTSFLENQSSNTNKEVLLTDKSADTPETQKKSKPAVPPRPNFLDRANTPAKPAVPPKPNTSAKPAVLPKPNTSAKPAVLPKPNTSAKSARTIITNKNLQPTGSSVTIDKLQVPPIPPVVTITSTETDSIVEKDITKETSRNNLLREIENFNSKKTLKKTNSNHPAQNINSEENIKTDLQVELKRHLSLRRKSIKPDND